MESRDQNRLLYQGEKKGKSNGDISNSRYFIARGREVGGAEPSQYLNQNMDITAKNIVTQVKYGYHDQNMDIKAKNIGTQVKLKPNIDKTTKIWISRPNIL